VAHFAAPGSSSREVPMDVVFPDIPVYQGWGAPLRI
jgi:hypothetical protein